MQNFELGTALFRVRSANPLAFDRINIPKVCLA